MISLISLTNGQKYTVKQEFKGCAINDLDSKRSRFEKN